MTLAEYLRRNDESDTHFGERCRPKIHRTKVYLYRLQLASPRADKIDAIERATGKKVRAKDLVRAPAQDLVKRKNGHNGSPGKVAHS